MVSIDMTHGPSMQKESSLQHQINSVEQMCGREGRKSLRGKAAEVGCQWREKKNGTWTSLRLEVLRTRVLDRLRTEAAAGTGAAPADGAGSCSGEVSDRLQAAAPVRKRLRSKTTANSSSSSSATTNERSTKYQKGDGQRVVRRARRGSPVTPKPRMVGSSPGSASIPAADLAKPSKFEVHWHCILANPDNIGWHKFMNDVEEMVRNNDGRGFCQVINDCDALDELFLAERSGAAAFGAADLSGEASEIRGHELARKLGQDILKGVEMVAQSWGYHLGFKYKVIHSDGWKVTADHWQETEKEPMEITMMCLWARALKLLKTFKTPCDDVVQEAEARTLLSIDMMEARESLWNGVGHHEHIAQRMSNAWKEAMRFPLARPKLQVDLGHALQCFNWLGTRPHDIAVGILEMVVEVAARGDWMALKAWESVDLPPAARTAIAVANAARVATTSLTKRPEVSTPRKTPLNN